MIIFVNLNLQTDFLQLDCESGQKSGKKPYSVFQPLVRSHVMLPLEKNTRHNILKFKLL